MSINSNSYFWGDFYSKDYQYRNKFDLQFNDFNLNDFLKVKDDSTKLFGEYNSNRFTLPMLAGFLDYQDIISFKNQKLTDYILMRKDKKYKIENKEIICKKHFNALMCCLTNNEFEKIKDKDKYVKTIFSLIFDLDSNTIDNPDILNIYRLNNSSDLSLLCNFSYTFEIFSSNNTTPMHILVVNAMKELEKLEEKNFLLINNKIMLYNKIFDYIQNNNNFNSLIQECPHNLILFTIINNIKVVNINVNAQDDWGITIFYILAFYFNKFFNKEDYGKAIYILINYLFILLDELGNMFGRTLIETRTTIVNKYNSSKNDLMNDFFINNPSSFLLLINIDKGKNIPDEINQFLDNLYDLIKEKIKIEGSKENISKLKQGGFNKRENYNLTNKLSNKLVSINNIKNSLKNIKNVNKKKINIAIIGGGPVGLFFAIKLFNNTNFIENYNVNIDIYECRQNYIRKQVLLIQPDVIQIIPDNIFEKFKEKGCYVLPPPLNKTAKCYLNKVDSGHFSIRTKTLESIFKKYILEKKLNINFINEKVSNNSITKIINKYNILISASGGNDPLPKLIRKNNYEENPLSYGIVFNFNVKKYENLKIFNAANKNNKPQHIFRGFRTQRDTFYIGIQISKNDLERINEIKKENYNNLSNLEKFNKLPSRIKKFFYTALTKYQMNKQIIFDSIEFSAFEIIKKSAIIPAGIYNKKKIFLIGDSLSTTHFFSGQGVNIGFKSADYLTTILMNEDSINKYKNKANEYKQELTKASEIVRMIMNEIDPNNI
jgi:ribosomal protein S9